ncbi:MAG: methyltransferase [Pseudomonadota bacterium]
MSDDKPAGPSLADAYHRGLQQHADGDIDAAVSSFKEALALDPEDHGGLAMRLAVMGHGPEQTGLPPAHVAALFGQAAETFDDLLVGKLGYHVPKLVRDRIEALGLGPWERMLDLGCGTGLMGATIPDLTKHITGVDLAREMLEKSNARQVYDALYQGDAVGFLKEGPEPFYDLVTATDVLPYIGALDGFFQGITRSLLPGGVLILSSETLPEDELNGRALVAGKRFRFHHDPDYLTDQMNGAGLDVIEIEPITVRQDEGVPLPGHLTIGRRRG